MAIVEALDDQGRWINNGTIHANTVIRNYVGLAWFLTAGRTFEDPLRAFAAIADPMGDDLHAEVFGLSGASEQGS